MKKIIAVFTAFVIFPLFLVGCKGAVKDIGDAGYVFEQISNVIEIDSRMPDLPRDRIEQYYGIDDSNVDSFIAKLPASLAFSSEIAVFKFKDAASAKASMDGFEKRADEVMKGFENYIPAQYEIAKRYVLAVKGKYLLFVIHEDSETAEKEFLNLFR